MAMQLPISGTHAAASSVNHPATAMAYCTMCLDDAPMRLQHACALCGRAYRKRATRAPNSDRKHENDGGTHHAFSILHYNSTGSDGLPQAFHTGYQLPRTAQGIRVLP